MGNMTEFREVVRMFDLGHLGSVVDHVVKPPAAASAWARLEAGEQFGNLVIDWRSGQGNVR